jgi:hypothetical protein
VVGFTSRALQVDADGAPNSYREDGKGLSYTCDGVVAVVNGIRQTHKNNPANWQPLCRAAWAKAQQTGDYSRLAIFGFLKDAHNRPVVQQVGDPLPGEAFITTTSVAVPGTTGEGQRRYVDATAIPYVVLPACFVANFKIQPGDAVVVYRPKTGKSAFGIYGDGGDLGEASVRLHQDLGNDPLVVSGGVQRAKRAIGDPVTIIVFPGRTPQGTIDSAAWRASIDHVGGEALTAFGGMARVRACTP